MSSDDRAMLNQVLGDMHQAMAFYHKMFVDSCLFIATGSLGIVAVFFGRAKIGDATGYVFPFLLVILATASVVFRGASLKDFRGVIKIVYKIDRINGMFEIGRFLKDDSLYPTEWKPKEGQEYRNMSFEYLFWFTFSLPVVLALLLFAVNLYFSKHAS